MLKHITSYYYYYYWRASIASETFTGVTQLKIWDVCWRASETLTGVKMKKSYLASERSERDTYRGNTIENRGCLFIYLYIWTYVCHFVL